MPKENERGKEGEITVQSAISDILSVDEQHGIFGTYGDPDRLKRLLPLVENLEDLGQRELTELGQALHGLGVQVRNAEGALKRGEAAFGVDEEGTNDSLWNSEEGVKKLTEIAAAQKEKVKLLRERVSNESQKRREAAERKAEEEALRPFRAEFEELSREEILEKLVDILEQLMELRLEKAGLGRELEYTSDMDETRSKQEAVERALQPIELRAKAAKLIAQEKKAG